MAEVGPIGGGERAKILIIPHVFHKTNSLAPLEKEKKNSLARVWKLQMWAKSFQVEVRDPEQHLGLLTRAWGRIH